VAEEPPVARDPAEIAATLGELGCLDLVELGQQAVLERIVQAAATCCGSTGGVGLLLLNPDQQLHYVAAAGRPRRSLAGSQVRLGEGPSVDAFLQDAPVASRHLAGEPRWPNFRPLALAALDFARIEQARDLIMERERLDEVAAVELLRLQAQIEGQPIRAVAERLLSRPRA
jgi:hypothetical protein